MIALGIALYVTLSVTGLAFMIAAGIAGRREPRAPDAPLFSSTHDREVGRG